MKANKAIVSLLLIAASVQLATAQKMVLYTDGNQIVEYDVLRVDSIRFVESSTSEDSVIHGGGNITTLWDLLRSNFNYSRFADIVRRAKFYKDNTHPVSGCTFADILNGGQMFAVWVPNNDAFTETDYLKWLLMCESESVEDGYRVQQQFLGNHIALWRHNNDAVVRMINGKNMTYDKINKTLEGISLLEGNIKSANGVMHVLNGIIPFRPNFYEYFKYNVPQTKLGQYIMDKDTTCFSPALSVEGFPDENGNPTYVDSVYVTFNHLLETTHYVPIEGVETWQMTENGFGSRINNEDSTFVMILPTDAAWDAAYAMLEPSYVYATTYDNKAKGDLGTKEAISLTEAEADSLRKMSIKMDMVSPLVFNINKQPRFGGEMWNLKNFDELKGEGAEYLLNTYGDTLRAVGDWQPSILFDGEMVEMSNGNAYEVSSWNFPPEYYTPDVEVEIENASVFYNKESTKYAVGAGSKRYPFSNEVYSDITEIYGKVSNNNFYHLEAPSPTSGPKVEIKLYGNNPNAYVPNAQVMSGKYDIQVVVVPYWYMDIAKGTEINFLDETKSDSAAAVNKYKFKATLSYNNNKPNASDNTKASLIFSYDGLKVDTLTVIEDFEFPYSYKNMRFSYPTLYIEGATTKNDAKHGYVYDFVIDKIILKRKK